jgi:hypothetical protein
VRNLGILAKELKLVAAFDRQQHAGIGGAQFQVLILQWRVLGFRTRRRRSTTLAFAARRGSGRLVVIFVVVRLVLPVGAIGCIGQRGVARTPTRLQRRKLLVETLHIALCGGSCSNIEIKRCNFVAKLLLQTRQGVVGTRIVVGHSHIRSRLSFDNTNIRSSRTTVIGRNRIVGQLVVLIVFINSRSLEFLIIIVIIVIVTLSTNQFLAFLLGVAVAFTRRTHSDRLGRSALCASTGGGGDRRECAVGFVL